MTTPARFRAVLLDMDGVLLDSATIHRRAYESALAAHGIPATYEAWAGRSTKDVMQELADQGRLPRGCVEDLTRAKQAAARSIFHRSPSPTIFPEVPEMLERLAKMLPIALCTSASPGTVEHFFSGPVKRKWFSAVVTSDDVKRAKPKPDIFHVAAAQLAVDPQDCLVVEDSDSGIDAGVAAGCVCARIDRRLAPGVRAHQEAERVWGPYPDLRGVGRQLLPGLWAVES